MPPAFTVGTTFRRVMRASPLLLLAAGAHAFHGRRADIVYSKWGYHEVTTPGGCAAEGLNDVLDLSRCISAASTLSLSYSNVANGGSSRPYGCSVDDSSRRRAAIFHSDDPVSVPSCSVDYPCICQDNANPPFVPPLFCRRRRRGAGGASAARGRGEAARAAGRSRQSEVGCGGLAEARSRSPGVVGRDYRDEDLRRTGGVGRGGAGAGSFALLDF